MVDVVLLFVGLSLGSIPLELEVSEGVAAVALELDGERVARMSGPSWSGELDLGAELSPRRLTAIALDANDREIARQTRFLNTYRPSAGVEYVLHRNSKGWLTQLELAWPLRGRARPGPFAVSVDGKAVDADDPSSVWLAPLDPSRFHVIEVVVQYSDGTVARDWLGFGGPYLEGGSGRLTPLQLEVGDGLSAISPEQVSATSGAGSVRVVAVEAGESEVIVVRDTATAQRAGTLAPDRRLGGSLAGARDAETARRLHAVPIEADEWVRILNPGPARSTEALPTPDQVKTRLTSDTPGAFGLLWHLRARDESIEAGAAWISDGLALAGGRLSTGRRRGAVVLVLAPDSDDGASRLAPEAALAYLDRLSLPLHVWFIGKGSSAPATWGDATEIRSPHTLEKALDELRAELDQRRVVWVEGQHLPGEVELALSSE